MKPSKKYSISLLVLFIVMSLSGATIAKGSSEIKMAAEGIILSVDFGNGTIREFMDLNGSTVLDVTSSVLEVQIQWFGSLAYIKGIEGLIGEGEYGWQYWVNGELASIAVNLYLLDNNDNISWVYSTPNQHQTQDPSFVPGIIIVSAAGMIFIAVVYISTLRRIR
ncbi:DUF4430 domain-containing protein [Candidatus Thorarchaeota archaeon]|nr:MAG: DUF4430 domain-containing protein [Candidatus Thorarchaeota archaeon]